MKERIEKMKNSKKKGFTLIELVVVIAILAILALIMVPNLTAYLDKAKEAKIDANMKNIHTAAEMVRQTESELNPDLIKKYSNANEDISVEVMSDESKAIETYYVEEDDDNIVVKYKGKDNITHIFPDNVKSNNEGVDDNIVWNKYSLAGVEIGTLNEGIDTWDIWDPYKTYLYQGEMNFDNNKLYRGILKNKDDDSIETLKSNPSKVNQTHQDFMWPDINLDNPSNVITLEFEVEDGLNIVFDVVDDGYTYGEQSLQFYQKYKTEIMQAASSNLDLVSGPWSLFYAGLLLEYEEENIEEYLTNKGYTEETLNDFIKWGEAFFAYWEDKAPEPDEPDEEVKSFFYDILFLYELETSLDKYSESSLISSHSWGFDEGYEWGRLSLKIEELNLIETVNGKSGDYPDSGEQNGFWYEKVS